LSNGPVVEPETVADHFAIVRTLVIPAIGDGGLHASHACQDTMGEAKATAGTLT